MLIPDNIFLAGAVDAVILVAKTGSTTCRDLVKTKQVLESAGAKILGVVVNEIPAASMRGHYKRYYSSYIKKGA
jgi:Mrp family chromosome partitioning ATPase